MLNDLFGDQDNFAAGPQRQNYGSCAEDLDLPPIERKQFVGLKNQGATCYLNSFFQLLFMIPDVRNIFLEIDVVKIKE